MATRPPARVATTSDGDDMDHEDDEIDITKLAPVFVHPYDDVPEPEPAPAPRRVSAASSPARPFGLVGVPNTTLRVRDVKVAAIGFSLGAVLVGLISWFGSRRGA